VIQTVKKHQVAFLNEGILLFERDFGIALGRIYSSNIFHIYFFSGAHVTMDFIELVYDFVNQHGNQKYLNLYEFEMNVDLDPEVRLWAAAPTGNKNTIADALVINSLAHKILANFYMKMNKPIKPTRTFTSQKKAVDWLLSI
jgi:hypothetical protein